MIRELENGILDENLSIILVPRQFLKINEKSTEQRMNVGLDSEEREDIVY